MTAFVYLGQRKIGVIFIAKNVMVNSLNHIIGFGSAIAGSVSLHHNRKSDHSLCPPTKQTEGRKVRDPTRQNRRDNRDARVLQPLHLDFTASVTVSDRRLQGVAMRSAVTISALRLLACAKPYRNLYIL